MSTGFILPAWVLLQGESVTEKLDTSGMLHTCGKKLTYAGIENGCHVLVCLACTDKHKQTVQFRIPVEDPWKLPFPWETPRIRTHNCRDCGRQIDEKQAKDTFEEVGRALCVFCDAREHGIEVMGFEI